jgi:hypothetical protein
MDAGTKIVRSFELVESIWTQIDNLGNSLAAMTEAALENGEFPQLQSAGASTWTYQESASGWNSTAYALSFPMMGKRRRKAEPAAWISYQISVFGGGIPPLDGGGPESIGPVIHVSFWHLSTDFDDAGMFVEFPPDWDDSWEIKDERLLFWKSEKEGEFDQWTFSIRLLDLNSEDAIRTSIIEPVRALLTGAQAASALPANLPGLIYYAGMSNDTLVASRFNKR